MPHNLAPEIRIHVLELIEAARAQLLVFDNSLDALGEEDFFLWGQLRDEIHRLGQFMLLDNWASLICSRCFLKNDNPTPPYEMRYGMQGPCLELYNNILEAIGDEKRVACKEEVFWRPTQSALKGILSSKDVQLKQLTTIDDKGDTLLHESVLIPHALQMVLQALPEADRLPALVDVKNSAGSTVIETILGLYQQIHRTWEFSEPPITLSPIIELLPQETRLKFMIANRILDMTVPKWMPVYQFLLEVIAALPIKERAIALLRETQDPEEDGDSMCITPTTLFNRVSDLGAILEILKQVPEEDRLKVLTTSDYRVDSRLTYWMHNCSHRPWSTVENHQPLVSDALELLPQNLRMQALESDPFGLYYLAKMSPHQLQRVFALLTGKEIQQLLTSVSCSFHKDERHNRIRWTYLVQPDSLPLVIKMLSPELRLRICTEQSRCLYSHGEIEYGETLLSSLVTSYRSSRYPQSTLAIKSVLDVLSLIPTKQLLLAMNSKIGHVCKDRGTTPRSLLSIVMDEPLDPLFPHVIECVFARLPVKDCSRLLFSDQKNKDSKTLLKLIEDNLKLQLRIARLSPELMETMVTHSKVPISELRKADSADDSDFIRYRLQRILLQNHDKYDFDDRARTSAWTALMAILKKNNRRGDITEESPDSPAVLLSIYIDEKTPQKDRELSKILLAHQYRPPKHPTRPKANTLALACIAHLERKKGESKQLMALVTGRSSVFSRLFKESPPEMVYHQLCDDPELSPLVSSHQNLIRDLLGLKELPEDPGLTLN